MAAPKVDVQTRTDQIIQEVKNGVFKPVYVLMGAEPFYLDMVCDAILDNCVDEFARDFNQTLVYGMDADPEQIISALRQYPMMSERLLVVIKDAQLMERKLDQLETYLEKPMDSSVLVLLMRGSTLDKRKALYKKAAEIGYVLESPEMRDYEVDKWIPRYFRSKGMDITPDAARLLREATGLSLTALASEADKIAKSMPQGAPGQVMRVGVEDIERNVGVSRQYSIFALTKALCEKDRKNSLKIAYHVGNAARFAMPAATAVIYGTFYKVLRYALLFQNGAVPSPEQKASALKGVSPYFYSDYESGRRNYSIPSLMSIIALLCEFDFRSKGGHGEDSSDADLLIELVSNILIS